MKLKWYWKLYLKYVLFIYNIKHKRSRKIWIQSGSGRHFIRIR